MKLCSAALWSTQQVACVLSALLVCHSWQMVNALPGKQKCSNQSWARNILMLFLGCFICRSGDMLQCMLFLSTRQICVRLSAEAAIITAAFCCLCLQAGKRGL